MKESQVIDWIINLAENKAKNTHMTSIEKKVFDARIKTMQEIKAKLKRIDYFGGVETLITKASTATKNEVLFPNND